MRSYILVTLIAFVATFSSPSLANDQERHTYNVETPPRRDGYRIGERFNDSDRPGAAGGGMVDSEKYCCPSNSKECKSAVVQAHVQELLRGSSSPSGEPVTDSPHPGTPAAYSPPPRTPVTDSPHPRTPFAYSPPPRTPVTDSPPPRAPPCHVAHGQKLPDQDLSQRVHRGQSGQEGATESKVTKTRTSSERSSAAAGYAPSEPRSTGNQCELSSNCVLKEKKVGQEASVGASISSCMSTCEVSVTETRQVAGHCVDDDSKMNCVTCTCCKSRRENVPSSDSSSSGSISSAASSEAISIESQSTPSETLVDDINAANLRLSATPFVAFIVAAAYMTL